MHVAVQGCSHGSLSAIYDSLAVYENSSGRKVDLLLLCGDFQALRNRHDFASLAVPVKYQSLGSFHQYYSGERVAPVLTLVIGGNHEASNYMWELYHGGWLAPNMYYLGCAGSVLVDGVRISGASGIFKSHDYHKGHFENVPFDRSTMRSIYHIREYDVAKLMLLQPRQDSVFLSHDWPISIARHGNTGQLLRRKPFFRDEINKNTLGSPPLLQLLEHLQPEYWFAAHLHVKFAAVFNHPVSEAAPTGRGPTEPALPAQRDAAEAKVDNPDEIDMSDGEGEVEGLLETSKEEVKASNPDEIDMSDEEEDAMGNQVTTNSGIATVTKTSNPDEIDMSDEEDTDAVASVNQAVASNTTANAGKAGNPDEIDMSDGEDEVPADTSNHTTTSIPASVKQSSHNPDEIMLDEDEDVAVPRVSEGGTNAQTQQSTSTAPHLRSHTHQTALHFRSTRFLALDKCGRGKDFLQYLDIPSPEPSSTGQPRLTFDPRWLAITRALHPFMSLQPWQGPLPRADVVAALVEEEERRIREEGLLVPAELGEGLGGLGLGDGGDQAQRNDGEEAEEQGQRKGGQPDGPSQQQGQESQPGDQGHPPLIWQKGPIDISRVQQFWPTAPPEAHAADGRPDVWYTNPQTEAFCGMLGIENRVNPRPAE